MITPSRSLICRPKTVECTCRRAQDSFGDLVMLGLIVLMLAFSVREQGAPTPK
jgi:hypothetical protein